MSNFFTRIKEAATDPRRVRGRGAMVCVSTKDLHELLHHYEQMDDKLRQQYYQEAQNDTN